MAWRSCGFSVVILGDADHVGGRSHTMTGHRRRYARQNGAIFEIAAFFRPLPHPTARHLALLRGLVEPVGAAGNLTTDAHLAALSVEHGAQLVSFDREFGRFPGLRWRHPADDLS